MLKYRSLLLFTFFVALMLPGSVMAQGLLTKIGSYETGIFDESAAEISAYDPVSQRVFFTNSDSETVEVVDISNPFNPTYLFSITLGGAPNSVDVANGVVAVAVQADPKTDPGSVEFYDTDGMMLGSATVGALPDMLTFTPDGMYVVVANEGEPSDDYLTDPEGSVSLVNASTYAVMNITFEEFNVGEAREADLPDGVRIFGPGASVAQDLEPEYITVSPDGATAYVIMQENNALAIVDIATATVSGILALGTKDHSLMGNGLDASNRDDAINITTWPIKGMYQPDAIASFEVDGQTYLITANEGDAREYIYDDENGDEVEAYVEETRVGDLDLDPTAFPDAAMLQDDAMLGRIKTTLANGDTDGDGLFEEIWTFGARSFTIWNGTTGALVYDSGDVIEQKLAELIPNDFNSTNDENDSFDNRSDDKGPEPEAVTVGVVGGVPHAFLGLERVGGVMVFDISDPAAPTFVDYNNARDFSIIFDPDTITPEELSAVGDLGAEDIEFISAADSPIGTDMLVVANEVSGNISIFTIGSLPSTATSLTVLHNNDGESQLVNAPGQEDFGGVARFKTLMDNLRAEAAGPVVTLSSGDNFLAGPEFQASLDLPDDQQLFESRALDLIGYDALAIGNHEFDFGPDVLERLIRDFDAPTPFLSANLDFTNEPGLAELYQNGRIAASTVVANDGQLFGIIGATTTNLASISSPRNVVVLDDVAGLVQAEIDALEANGINKIILISHLQGVGEDQELISMLSGIDIAIAGGGDELLANEGDLLVPGDEIADVYPLTAQDMTGTDVPVVTTAGNYKYIGRLIVDFDDEGNLTGISDESGPVRVSGVEADAVDEDQDVLELVTNPVTAALEARENNIIATSEVGLDGVRGNIRSVETNLGNLITDAYLWQAEQLADQFGVDVPQVALANGGGIRNDNVIPAGDISELATFDILPFSNFLTVVPDVPVTQFKELLENAVSAIGGTSGTGRFSQVAGLTMIYDPSATPQDIECNDDNSVCSVVTPGERVRRVVLDNGTLLINNGEIVDPSATIDVVSVDFLVAGNGDEYPYNEAEFVTLGVTYQKTLFNYIVDGLGGEITAAQYPEGGEGRITEVGANEAITLTVLHNNDGESQLLFAPGEEDFGGAARFKTLMDNLRTEADEEGAVMTLSSGDNFLAGPEFQVSLDQPEEEQLFESIALGLIGYDALAIGNHEFDFGPDVLARLISNFQAPTPFLSANLDVSGEEALAELEENGRIAKSAYFVKDGQLIGVVGATTPNLPFISSPRNVTVMDNVAELVQAEIDALTSMGVNKIILISHLQGIEEDQELISMLTDVDIAIAGGGDELLANEGDLLVPGDEGDVAGAYPLTAQDMMGNDVPVVTTAGNYKYIGRLIVDFDADGNITTVSEDSGPVRVSGTGEDAVEEDQDVIDQVTDPVASALEGLANNVIATSEVALDGVRGNIRSIETNLGNLITDAYLWQAAQLADEFDVDAPQVAFANGGGIRNDNVIPAGNITELTTFDILPFGNQLTVVEDIPATQFKELLENGVSAIGGGSGTGRFLQVGGMIMRYDTTGTPQDTEDGAIVTPGTRVVTVILDDGTVVVDGGEVVDEALTIDVVTVNFTANGGDEFIFGEGPFTSLGVTYQKTLANYIVEGLGGTITAAAYPEGGEGRILTTGEAVSVEDPAFDELPREYALNGNYPNPFNPTTNISFSLPEVADVELAVYDMLGRQVMVLVNSQLTAGEHEIQFAADNLPSGTYFYRLSTPKGTFTKQMILLK